MTSLALQLNPLSRLKIYRHVRAVVLEKMNRDEISPARAKEIILYLQQELVKVSSAVMAILFCDQLSLKYPEIKNLTGLFEQESNEKIDQLIMMVIEKIMEENQMDQVDALLEEMKNHASQKEAFAEQLKTTYPALFEESFKALTMTR